MKAAPQEPRFDADDLRESQSALEALTHWDELDAALIAEIEAHPQHAPRLALLRAAEGWMNAQVTAEHEAFDDCPIADDLYDFGRGPGCSPLPHDRRAAIDRHLLACSACELLVESLATTPPLPLEMMPIHAGRTGSIVERVALETADVFEAPKRHFKGPTPRVAASVKTRSTAFSLWIPIAAAASLLVTFGLWTVMHVPERASLPRQPILRGEAGGPLLFPRDRLLAADETLRATWPALGNAPVFEIEPRAEASAYHVTLSRHEGGAFDADAQGTKLESASPRIASDIKLAPGRYTWDAWAVVRGLDQRLGARDFDVVTDAALVTELAAIAEQSEPERTFGAVRLLDARGYRSDARTLAATLPPSAERDAYLGQTPGR